MIFPVPENEHERLQALWSYDILYSLEEEEFNNIVETASLICDTPIAVISLIDENKQWIKAKKGIDIKETQRCDSICQYTILSDQLFEVSDLSKDARFAGINHTVDGSKILSYTGFPLIDPHGYALGSLCVIDHKPKKLKEKQKRLLELLAKNVVTLLLTRKQAKEAKYFAELFDSSRELLCLISHDGLIEKANPAFQHLLGWSNDELLKMNILDIVFKEDRKKSRKELEKMKRGRFTINFTNRLLTKKGEVKTIQWSITPNVYEKYSFVVGRDITIETAKNLALEISENKLRSFFENSQGLMCTHDLEGRLLSVNQAGAALLGYKKEEVLKMSLADLIPAYHHDFFRDYLTRIQQNRKDAGLMKTLHRDGSTLFWLYNNVLEKDSKGKDYVIGNAIDLTERLKLERDLKKTKEMLEQTNRVARVGGWEVDLVNDQLIWSDITKEILEIDHNYQPKRGEGFKFYYGESRKRLEKAFEKALQSGVPFSLELQLITAKKRLIWVRCNGKAEIQNGVCKRVFGTFQDITDSYNKKEELKKAKLLAEQASRAKSEFLANMSHEIRTPLNGVIGFTDLILKTSLNSIQRQYLSIVNDSALSLLAIINDILDFSKIEAGKLELNIEKVDLFDLGEQVINVIIYQAQKKELELLLDISPDLPRFVWIDDARLKQILVNLLGNAIKFTESGEIGLKVEAISSENVKPNNKLTLRFSVTDTGIGIHPDRQHKIFEAFSQEDNKITKKYGGTGLGLTISNKLLDLMGSRLNVESTLGKGSVFFFDLESPFEYGPPIENTEWKDIHTALIVDDNEHNCMILERMLMAKHIVSESVSNGFEALQKLYDGKKYDLLIIDYHMPILNGLEVVRKIRQNPTADHFNVPIILLHSSSEDATIIKESKELVMISLTKPISSKEMYEALRKVHNPNGFLFSGIDSLMESVIGPSFRVLIAEDNEVNMLLISTIMERIAPNAEVYKVGDGQQAVSWCEKEIPDLILMDLQMPVLNGFEATRYIRALPAGKEVIIIALTAGNVKGEREKCLKAGFNDFIAKPIIEKDIESKLKEWLPKKMESDLDEELHFNSKKLEEYAAGDQQFAQELINATLSELKKALKKLGNKGIDLNELKHLGHKLAGTAGTAGLTKLMELAVKLENGDGMEGVVGQQLLDEIRQEIKLIDSIFKRKFNSL